MKLSLLCGAALFMLPASAAFSCPDYRYSGLEIYASATDLWSPQSFNVVAGGANNLEFCPVSPLNAGRVWGYAAQAPDFKLRFYKNANYRLDFRVRANCDTVLLVNTGAGNWYFDDDDGGAGNPRISLTRPSDGWYDIWVGTFFSEYCDAVLELETF